MRLVKGHFEELFQAEIEELFQAEIEELFQAEIEKRWQLCAPVYWTVSPSRQSLMHKHSVPTGKLITENVHPNL